MKTNHNLQLKGGGFKGSMMFLLETLFLFVGTGLALLVAITPKSIVSKHWEGEYLPALTAVLVMTIFVIMDRKIFGIDDKTSYTLEDFVPGSCAKLIQCYFDGIDHWAIFCPVDKNPSDGNVVHVKVNNNFMERFGVVKNVPVRFVATRGDITWEDEGNGVWPAVLSEILGESKPLRCQQGDDKEDFCGNKLTPSSPFTFRRG